MSIPYTDKNNRTPVRLIFQIGDNEVFIDLDINMPADKESYFHALNTDSDVDSACMNRLDLLVEYITAVERRILKRLTEPAAEAVGGSLLRLFAMKIIDMATSGQWHNVKLDMAEFIQHLRDD